MSDIHVATRIDREGAHLARPVRMFGLARAAAALALACALATGPGCVDVEGGAVELSWTLLTFEDRPIADNCTGARISEVRLHWEPAAGNTAGSPGMADFPCGLRRGVTGFELEDGPYSLWIEPICTNGMVAIPRTYEVPPPVIRTARHGQVNALGSLLIVADDSSDLSQEELANTECTCCPGSFTAALGGADALLE